MRTLLWRALRRRPYALVRICLWSVLEAGPAFLIGYAVARAIEDGFAVARPSVGLAWLAALGCTWLVAAVAARQVILAVAAVAEPFRDDLLTHVVGGAMRRAAHSISACPDTAAVTRAGLQVELARDAFAAVITTVRGFAFTVVSVVLGLLTLAPAAALLVLPPFAAGLGLFLVSLPALARRQRAFLMADERLAESMTGMAGGLRDIVACGAEDRVGAALADRVEAQASAARGLARVTAVRTIALAVGAWLPVVLVLGGTPWLLSGGAGAGVVVGALAYVTQSLAPALNGLVQGLGVSGVSLVATLRRIATSGPLVPSAAPGSAGSELSPEALTAGLEAVPSAGVGCSPEVQARAAGAGQGTTAPIAGPGEAPSAPMAGTRQAPAVLTEATVALTAGSERSSVGGVRLRGVTFAYGPHSEAVIDGLDLDIPEGDHLAVVGPSGAGKSTLAALVSGLIQPDTGDVRIGGVPSVDVSPAARVLIPQEAYVFRGSLHENLTYLSDAPPHQVEAAIAALGATGLTAGPAELDPGALSAGQRQLIALVRAYLAPASLVILDEATCHLDPAAEARVEDAFARRGGTLIVVAHRLTSATRARRILLMDAGQAVVGTHDQLVRRSPTYADLSGYWQPEPVS
ncbi:ATP-binding cassette domain-containing protein [Nonomuraea guangzhouensis]|uniref:ATP-binding cassette domain-containing protein n=1 Tax=Nonomuraea guangzhouensis TaxID=1291555 RepID=A0ABW4GTI8_9ACTN|nr:ATP-binding cassette domain-containing protein [Nonomuraea guangzhouensis]